MRGVTAGETMNSIAGAEKAQIWRRGPATFDGEWIQLELSKRTQLYQPLDIPGLPFDLAGVRSPADALSFVGRYGLLAHSGGDDPNRPPRELFSAWQEQIRLLNAVLALARFLRQAERGEPGAIARLREYCEEGHPARIHVRDGTPDSELIRAAGRALADWISFGLGPTQGRINSAAHIVVSGKIYGPASQMVQAICPSTLIGYAYLQVSRHLSERGTLRVCLEPTCGRAFPVKDPRQVYCSSTCSNRTRQRKSAERRKAATL